ncbi:MAG: MarR family transcriptional regulator [Nocardioidaceae bacterium]|nr:MarR family transcriptional regulator [Nocardioidaceae bacterium]
MSRPAGLPIGLRLANTSKAVGRAFDDALIAVGGTVPTWLVLIALKTRPTANQRQLADAVGIQGATLTHHLNGMERAGLLTRRRDPDNRRMHVVSLTDEGEAAFHRMRRAAVAFDQRLRNGLDAVDVAHLESLLRRLHANVSPAADLQPAGAEGEPP